MNTILTTEIQDNSGNLFLQTLDSLSAGYQLGIYILMHSKMNRY